MFDLFPLLMQTKMVVKIFFMQTLSLKTEMHFQWIFLMSGPDAILPTPSLRSFIMYDTMTEHSFMNEFA